MDRFIEHYAKARQTASSGYYEDGSERDRGVRNQKIQYLGVAGEIIARNILKTNGKKYEASQLVSNVADLKPDLYIEYSQSKVDVKCFDDNEFKINYKKIERPKYEVDWFGSLNWKKNHTLPIIFLFLTTMFAVTLKLLRGLRNITVIALIILIFLLLKIYMALKRLNRS